MIITGIDVYELVAAMHNATVAVGIGKFHDIGPMSAAELRSEFDGWQEWIEFDELYVDYLYGRPVKVRVRATDGGLRVVVSPLYERIAGDGAFLRAVESARGVVSPEAAE